MLGTSTSASEVLNYGREKLKNASTTITVQEVIDGVNAADLETPKWFTNPKQTSEDLIYLVNALVEAGFTKLDFIYLPQETITPEVIAKTSKKIWLDKSILVLGTLTLSVLEHLQEKFQKVPSQITIRELLGIENLRNTVCGQNTREALKALGFGYNDGVLLQVYTEESFIELIMKECGLSKTKAKTVFDFVRSPRSAGLTNKLN